MLHRHNKKTQSQVALIGVQDCENLDACFVFKLKKKKLHL